MTMQDLKTFLDELPDDRRAPMRDLVDAAEASLPPGFERTVDSMVHYVVPLDRAPEGYLGDPDRPIPFISLASTRGHIALHHMGLYMSAELTDWFHTAHKEVTGRKPDAGKSCIRFKRPAAIPLDLVRDLCGRMSLDEYLTLHRSAHRTSS